MSKTRTNAVESITGNLVDFPTGAGKGGKEFGVAEDSLYVAATKAVATIKALGLPDGAKIQVDADETMGGVRVWWNVMGGVLVDPVVDTAEGVQFTPDGLGSIPFSVAEMLKRDAACPEDFGALPGADATVAIQRAIDTGREVYLAQTYLFSSLTIPTSTVFEGPGSLVGIQNNGTKPTVSDIKAGSDLAARLAILSAYNKNTITLTGTSQLAGNLKVANSLITASGMDTVIITGRIRAVNSSAYRVNLVCRHEGTLVAEGFISSDAPQDGVRADYGGKVFAPGLIVFGAVRDGVYVFLGGMMNIQSAFIWNSGRMGLHVNGGGSVYAQQASVRYSNNQSVAVEYGGSINFFQGNASDSVGSAGLTAESSGVIYAQGATITNNALWPISTSYGGFVQAKMATITGNGRPITTLTGGTIQVLGATVSGNNSGGVQMEALAQGIIISEPAGKAGSGKDTLTASQYSPPYGVMGNGMGMIYDAETETKYPNDSIGINRTRSMLRKRPTVQVVSNEIVISSSYVLVDNSSAAQTISTITFASGFETDEVFIAPLNSSNTVTISANAGNIRLQGGNIVMSGVNDVAHLVRMSVGRWSAPRVSP